MFTARYGLEYLYIIQVNYTVSRKSLTSETRVRYWASPCEICGRQSGNGDRFISE